MEEYIWKYFAYAKMTIPKDQRSIFIDKNTYHFVNKTSSDDILAIVNRFNGSSTTVQYNTIFEIFQYIDKKIIIFTNVTNNETLTINNNKEGQIILIYECLKDKIEILPITINLYKKSDYNYSFTISYKDKPWFIEVIKNTLTNFELFNYRT